MTRTLIRLVAALLLAAPLLAGCAGAQRPGAVFTDGKDLPRMVVVPAGTFAMGSSKGEADRPEGPVRQVAIARAFALAETPVTVAQFGRFVAETGYTASTDCRMLDPADGQLAPRPGMDWRHPGKAPLPSEPVTCVSWRDATAYIAWLAAKTHKPYRLPSEAEWEYAARAGSAADYPWGDDPDQACRWANVYDQSGADKRLPLAPARCDDGFPKIAPVGSFPANAFGLKDMIGNAWQWVEDCYVMPYPAGPLDGSAVEPPNGQACDRRAVRGGSWISAIGRQRVSFRGRDPDTLVSWIFGFRVARDL